jgi:LppP/LprE lipoprotein
MRRGVLLAATVVLGATGGALLGGCGSGTTTVSVSSAPPSSLQTSTASTSATTTQSTQTTSTSTTSSSSTTHTASEPAFVGHTGQGGSSSGSAAAEQTLRAHGFTATNVSDYHPKQTLGVLVGRLSGSGDGYGQQAFFFVNGKYIGTDARQLSAGIHVLSQSDTEVTLAYSLYRPHDPLCCPGGGQARVRFQLDNGKLTPLDPIPPTDSKTGTSRQ